MPSLRDSTIWEHAKRDGVLQRRLIADVSEFVSAIASLQAIDELKTDATPQSFLELIINDGNATFDQPFEHSSVYTRRLLEHNRMQLDSKIDELCKFCDRYRFLLSSMARIACETSVLDESIDLFEIVASEDLPSGGYFVRISLADAVLSFSANSARVPRRAPNDEPRVTVGGFAIELAKVLEEPMEKWILACENKIESLVPTREDLPFANANDAHRKKALRKRLVKILTEHVAMVGLFRASDGPAILLERQPTQLSTSTMESLIADFADDSTREHANALRESTVMQLRLLTTLCRAKVEETALRIAEQQGAFLSAIRAPPSVLTRRPGYASLDLRLHTLLSIVRNATTTTLSLTTVQLKEWQFLVGDTVLRQLDSILTESIGILSKQRFPDRGFIPTLKQVCPPSPTWTSADGALDAYVLTRASMPAFAPSADAHVPLPSTTEQILRLISFVWELMAYQETRSLFFTPGRVTTRYLRDVVSIEQVNVAFASMTLSSWKQKCGLGRNFRNAANAIAQFQGSEVESFVREAFSKLCHWSLVDIMSVVSEEHSPIFLASQWKLVDAVSLRMQSVSGMSVQCSNVLGRVLDVVEPIVLALRTNVGLRSIARPHPLADLLRIIPAVRRWDGTSDELILTVEEVAESKSKRVRALLQSLSDQRSIVRFGRLGRGRAAQSLGYGAKRVFCFNGHDLSAVLFGEAMG